MNYTKNKNEKKVNNKNKERTKNKNKKQVKNKNENKNIYSKSKKYLLKINNIDVRILFCIKFFLIFFLLSFIIEQINLSFLTNYLTFIIASLMSLPYHSNMIFSGKNFLITNMCTGLTTVSILAATIFSMQKPKIKNKIILFLGGAVFIFLLNIPRIMVVIYSEIWGFDSELVHTLSWFVMSGVVLFIVMIGLKFYYKKDLINIL